MKPTNLIPKILVVFTFIGLSYAVKSQDFSAGINTETPNPNAVLHLVAPNGDQGFLVPTTDDLGTTGAGFSSPADNGMLVFHTPDGLFYFWYNNVWFVLDNDLTNESITSATITGNTLTITEGGINIDIDLSPFDSAPQDILTDATAGNLSISGGSTLTINVDDADADPSNEIQDIATDASAGNISITGGSTLTLNVDDADADPTNEIELPLTATIGEVLEWNGTAWVAAADDGALPPGTVIGQILEWDGTNWNPGTDEVDDADADPANEIQDIATDASAGNISIAGGSTLTLNVDDADADPNNEIELPPTATIGEVLEWNGTTWVAATDDGLVTVTTDITLVGDGTVGTPLTINRVNPNIIAAGGAVATQILKFNGTNWVPVADDIALADGATITGDGGGTPYAVNVGTGANQIVQLDAGGALPSVDGSALTGITPTLGVGTVTSTEIADGTIATIDIANLAVTDALINDVAVGKITGAPNLDTDATDDLTAVASDATLGGDGTVGTPLAVNVGTGANQIIQLDAGGALPAVDGSALTGITPALGVGSVTTAEIADGTIATLDIANLAVTDAQINDVAVGKITGAPNLDTDATDDLTAVASDATLGGDGTVGTPLAVNVGTGANQIVQLDAGGSLPAVDGSALTGITPALGVGSITTTEIADGTIADIDIAAGAAISGAKVNPNFGAQDIIARSIDIGPGVANIDNSGNGGFSNNLTVGNNLGVSGSITASTLSVAASSMTVNATGNVVATSFSGDGSALTGITPTIGAGSVTTTEILDGTISTIDIANLAVTDALINDVAVGKITGAPNLDTDATDDLTTTDVGTGAGQLVALSAANTLPILDGSNLTGITVGAGSVTTTEILNGTIATIDIANLAVTDALINDVAVGKITGAPNLDTDATDDLTTTDVGTGAGQVVALSAANTLPILDGSNLTGVMDVATYDPNTVAGDAFAFGTHTSATAPNAGDVLTFGGGSWDAAAPVGLTLPYSQTETGTGADLFDVINDGTGGAAAFQILNAGNVDAALTATTNGSGAAILATNTGTTGPAVTIDVTGAGNPGAGLALNHAGTGPGILLTTTGPLMNIPGGAAGEVLASDASGNISLQPGGLTLPFTGSDAGAGPLFSIENTGAGPAASFTNIGDGVALGVSGNIAFSQGSDRTIRIVPSVVGNGDNLQILAGNAIVGGPADGGNLLLQSGSGTGATGNGGNIRLQPGDGGASGNPGRVLIEGVTRIGNPRPGFGGAVLLEDDGGTNAIAIRADPATTAYDMILPLTNASGVLTNDGAGTLSWTPSGLTFPSSTVQTEADTLFNLTNPGSGPAAGFAAAGTAATFRSLTNGTAVLVDGNMEFLDGINRDFGILPNLGGPGDLLNVYSGDAAGPGGNGGDLVMSSGLAAGVGDGGNILITPGAGAGGGFTGGVFIDAITSITNPNPGFGGILELVNDAETFAISIEAEPTMAANYTITLPGGQGAGALTNDGAGNLSWSPAGGAGFTVDASQNIISSNTAASPGTGTDNFLSGFNAGASLTSGSNNIYVGTTAGFSTQDGLLNIGIGANAGSGITSGQGNIMIGQDAGSSVTTGTGNVIIGQGASTIDDSSPHVVIGQGAAADGVQAVAIGAGTSASGDNSFAIGPGATVTQDETAVIGDPANPPRVGFGTNTPNARIQAVVSGATTLDVMNLTNDGDGRSLSIDVVNNTNTAPAVLLAQNSGGAGIDARITNATSTATVITAINQGDGNVAFFNQSNTTSGGDAMFVQTAGLGAAGVFQTNNAASGSPTLAVNSNANANTLEIVRTGPNGNGISVDMNINGGSGLLVAGTAAGLNSIVVDGGIELGTKFTTLTNPTTFDVDPGTPVPNTHRVVRIVGTLPFDAIELTGVRDGQEIILICEGGTPQASPGPNFRLDNNNALAMSIGSSLHLIYIEALNQWVEISRSR